MSDNKLPKFENLAGQTLKAIDGKVGGEEVVFTLENGDQYKLYHQQDCCENVAVEDIAGSLDDLIGSPILLAEEVSSEGNGDWGTFTWTFYKLATNKGYATIRFYGESNGYYSEDVDWVEVSE